MAKLSLPEVKPDVSTDDNWWVTWVWPVPCNLDHYILSDKVPAPAYNLPHNHRWQMESLAELKTKIKDTYSQGEYPEATPFVEHYKRTFGESLMAVVLYGSTLCTSTQSETSIYDFFLIAEDYRTFHKKWSHRWVNQQLAPALFYLELDVPGRGKICCKYNVVSISDLEKATEEKLQDFYLIGRFSKRLAALYTKDDWALDKLARIAISSWTTLAQYALVAGSSEFDVPDFAKSLLLLSYLGEVRIEDTKGKVDALYNGFKPFYDQVFEVILRDYKSKNRDQFKFDEALPEGRYLLRRTPALRAVQFKNLNKLIKRSRTRAKMRWPLMIFTVDNWVDILLAKLERTHGVKLELSPFERKFILIFGWRHYFRLKKEGKIK